MRPISIGNDGFYEIRKNNAFYVDKTMRCLTWSGICSILPSKRIHRWNVVSWQALQEWARNLFSQDSIIWMSSRLRAGSMRQLSALQKKRPARNYNRIQGPEWERRWRDPFWHSRQSITADRGKGLCIRPEVRGRWKYTQVWICFRREKSLDKEEMIICFVFRLTPAT